MIFKSTKFKPSPSEIKFCNFRSSKAYLWSVIADRLESLQALNAYPLNILDAACHSLITRDIFPHSSSYFGLDISVERLSTALPLKRINDILFLGDLLLSLPFKYSFDVVVSCNTMSHLSPPDRMVAIRNLIETLKPNSTFIVNLPVDEFLYLIFPLLNQYFLSADILYFDSFLSHQAESSGQINHTNVTQCVNDYEISLPNDALFHRQVLIQCDGCKNSGKSLPLDIYSSSKINVVNKLRPITKSSFQSDELLVRHILSQDQPISVVFTPLFLASPSSACIISLLSKHKISFFNLSFTLDPDILSPNIFVIGLESTFVHDNGSDRLALNRLRRSTSHSLHYILIKSRNGKNSFPSVIFND